MRTTSKTLHHFISKAGHLYSLPAVAMEVLELTNRPEVDLRALKQCIENDPALTSKILRVVNSSLFGLSSEVSNLQQALSLLGLKPLKLLVLGFSLADTSFSKLNSDVMGRYWRYALTKAVAAREISRQVWRLPGDEPFIAALLQDLGMLVLIQELGFPYTRFADKVCATHGDLTELEIESLGFDHTLLTCRLLEKWSFPKSLCEAVIADRRPGEVYDLSPSQRTLCQIVHLAKLLADLLVFGRQDVLPQVVSAGASEHQLNVQQLVELVCDMQGKVHELADLLSLQLPPGVDYRDVLAQAQAQLAEVAEQTADQMLGERRDSKHDGSTRAVWEETRSLTGVMEQFLQRPTTRETRDIHPTIAPGARHLATLPAQHPAHGDTLATGAHFTQRGGDLGTATNQSRGAALAVPNASSELPANVMGRLSLAVNTCRQGRLGLSLALVEIDHLAEITKRYGPIQSQLVVRRLSDSLAAVDLTQVEVLQVSEAQFAIILPGCDRALAVQLGNQIVRSAGELLSPVCIAGNTPHSVSVGVATVPQPSKNFGAAELAEPAARCLAAAQRAGGNAMKSIGVY